MGRLIRAMNASAGSPAQPSIKPNSTTPSTVKSQAMPFKLMADSPQNMATIDSEGLRLNGIACDLTVDGVVLFGLVPG